MTDFTPGINLRLHAEQDGASTFVEIEDDAGRSIKVGTVTRGEDGDWSIRITAADIAKQAADRHSRPLGGDRERDGRLLAAAQGVDLTAGTTDNSTRAYWYQRADAARAKLADWAEHPSDCLCRHGQPCPAGGAR